MCIDAIRYDRERLEETLLALRRAARRRGHFAPLALYRPAFTKGMLERRAALRAISSAGINTSHEE